ncbi:MAG TPA: stage IV sporulation protein A [Candidatus Ornithomonoglobus intestinigallinarum]|uniref:Stage IV sporulation protein A n=1 Tax=Candidatus Ornithomonoglobus intestinigallinarum TaxID=2840894 RepID=A0A9D1H1C1_9FIRM|nr:stage IV sporulation protein A [Candidatus Ornithomonoglobus intestinigallinarum]
MEEYNIYRDIAQRNHGDVYIGVVGPVRTGKSTFIKKFMDLLVIPNMDNVYQAERTRDELPQSAAGRTIMTTEPKFIPNEAAEISMGDNAHLRVRMIDCVGYIVDSSLGYFEENEPRMVNTPWFDHPIPFNEAAELGTKKVITEHSTIGLVVTTDGTVTDINRDDYIPAENRVINELKAINKPFAVLLNSASPESEAAQSLRAELEAAHGVPVIAVNCAELVEKDVYNIIETVLFEFPLKEIDLHIPNWLESLDMQHPLKSGVYNEIIDKIADVSKVRQARSLCGALSESEYISRSEIEYMDLGEGTVKINVEVPAVLYYKTLGELTGFEINGEEELMELLCSLAEMKKEYDRISSALRDVRERGYGVVSPSTDELTLDEPKIVRQGGRYGVKLKASAPSIHMIRADIETEVSPIVGTEKQSEELVHYLLSEFETNPAKIWESNIFGKSLYELVNEGLNNKLSRMPEEARNKIRDTLQKIINEGSGGLICIIL